MSELKYCNDHCRGWSADKECRGHKVVDTYNWTTEYSIGDNSDVIIDWINYHMPDDWTAEYVFLTYAEVVDGNGQHYDVYAKGITDYSHAVNIFSIEGDV